MIIIIVFPDFKNYPERLKLYYKMGKFNGIDKIMIFTRGIPEDFDYKKPDKVSIEIIKNKKRFYIGIKNIIKRRIKNKKNIIIINHFINITPFSKKTKNGKNIKVITKFYSPNLLVFSSKRKKILINLSQKILFFKRALLDIYSAFFSDIIIGNSKDIEMTVNRMLKIFYLKRKVVTFPTPVDTDFFTNENKKYNKSYTKLLFVGNLLERKGIFDLIEIGKLLKQSEIDYKLFIIGKFVWEKTKKKMIIMMKKYNIETNFIFLGFMNKNKLKEYYNSCDIFLFPSYYEGSPRVVKEALSCGLPVIAYNIGGVRLIDKGNNIIQSVEPGDIKEAFEKLLILIKDKKMLKAISSKGRKYMEKEFSINSIAEKEINLFFELLGEG